jgi:hypothetical protein
MALAEEAELGTLLANYNAAVEIQMALEEMGHKQQTTAVMTGNSTAAGFVNHTFKKCKTRAIDMRCYWIKDRKQHRQLLIYWMPGTVNLGDYHNTHHPPGHHKKETNIFS